MGITIEDVHCPACEDTFGLDDFDPEDPKQEVDCPNCGKLLLREAYDPITKTLVLVAAELEGEDEDEPGAVFFDDEDDE